MQSHEPAHTCPALAPAWLRALILAATLVALAPPALAQTASSEAAAAGGTEQAVSAENVQALIEAARAELEALPKDAEAGSAQARLRAVVQRRVSLLERFARLVAAEQSYAKQQAALPERIRELEARKQAPALEPDAGSGGSSDKEALDRLEALLTKVRPEVNALREEIANSQARLSEGIRQDQEASRERADEASKRAPIIEQQLAEASDDVERRALTVEAGNLTLEKDLAEQAALTLAAEASYERVAEPVETLALEVEERRLAALEERFAALAQSLQDELATEKVRAEAELAQKEASAERADTPTEKFLAEWEAELARSHKSSGDVASAVIPLKKDVAEQTTRLAAERQEDVTVRNLIKRSGTSGSAGERLNRILRQLKRRQAVVARSLAAGHVGQLPELRDRRFAVEDLLIGLGERFNERKAELAEGLEGQARLGFTEDADKLLPEVRTALRAERLALSEAIGLGTQLQALLEDRLELQKDLERYIRARAFWLRDGKPLGGAFLESLSHELTRLRAWVSEVGSPRTRAELEGQVSDATAVVYALLLFPIAPLLLFWARQRLRGITRSVNDRVLAEGRRPALLLTTLLTGFSSAALLPAYLLLASRLVQSAGLPSSIGPVVGAALQHLAAFLFLWFVLRSFFHRRGISEVQFQMSREAANAFYRSARWFLVGYLMWLAPARILHGVPFGFEALPRLGHVLFLLTALAGVVTLVRKRSAFVQHRLALLNGAWPASQWGVISTAIVAVMAGAVLLEVLGYRYASSTIGLACLLSLLVLVVLPPLYTASLTLLAGVERRRQERSVVAELTGEGDESEASELESRARRFLRGVFVIGGVVLLLAIWGIDQQALATLDEWHVYAVRGSGETQEFVTAGDLVRCVFFLLATVWLLRSIPGVYEFAIFPRMRVDDGVKYALLTITRYMVFVVGIFLALGEIHLDLGRLGWLMAAVGVGLGFGLQEIVSNFVSGLILLIERPVRPGDVVSVGGMTGTVQRINIRATTIMNFDRQEVLVPNRSLITSEVTNWTRGDTTNRVVVPIGVAYGSDVDEVTEVLTGIAAEAPGVLDDPAPQVFFMNHGESSLDFELRMFVPSPSELLKVRNHVNKAINREFARRGIEIPFPQRDLHIRSSVAQLGREAAE